MLHQSSIICPWCGQPTLPDYVHGHAQCQHCKTNFAPCCDGGTCEYTPLATTGRGTKTWRDRGHFAD